MGRTRVALALALLVLPALAGCFEDLERVELESSWEADGELYRGPAVLIAGAPAQLVVEGQISLPADRAVELTGLGGTLTTTNRTIPMQPVRLTLNGETFEAPNATDAEVELTDGDRARLTLLPEEAGGTQLGNTTNWTGEAELTYRYRQGPEFDAGRFSFEANLTLRSVDGLGLGVARTNGTQISSLVFADVPADTRPGQASVQVFRVTPNGISLEAERTTRLELGNGVVIGQLETSVEVREGSGYQILYADSGTSTGVVAYDAGAGDQPVPSPSPIWLLVAATAAAGVLRWRRD